MTYLESIQNWIAEEAARNNEIETIYANPNDLNAIALELYGGAAAVNFTSLRFNGIDILENANVLLGYAEINHTNSRGFSGRYVRLWRKHTDAPTKKADGNCPVCSTPSEPRTFNSFSFQYCPVCKEDIEYLAKKQASQNVKLEEKPKDSAYENELKGLAAWLPPISTGNNAPPSGTGLSGTPPLPKNYTLGGGIGGSGIITIQYGNNCTGECTDPGCIYCGDSQV